MNSTALPRGLSLGRTAGPEIFLGRYQSERFLGSGSMGKVYLAHLIGSADRKVVVKIMHPHVAADPKARQLFEREVQSLGRLRHPYIVQLLDSSIKDSRGPALVMEYIPGSTLEEFLTKKGRLAVGHVGLLLGYLCHALDSAHALGIVHRDLKPANLMIVGADSLDESLRVMDFGLAQIASKPHFSAELLAGVAPTITQGTPSYIAPEMLRSDEIDGRSDLYSTGVMLFEMLSGQLPYPHNDVRSVLRAHLHENPQRFATLGVRDIPPGVEQVVSLCLSKYPVERPQTARELARTFSAAIDIDIWEATMPESVPEPAPAPAPIMKHPLPSSQNAISHRFEAWMPERIAVVKLRGFLEDLGGKVVESQPGMLRIRLGEPQLGAKNKGQAPLPVEIALLMEKPDARDNRLIINALFRPFTNAMLLQTPAWLHKCDALYRDLQAYLMAR
jgi:eukaryotic-like serine/threonine-protein kinase